MLKTYLVEDSPVIRDNLVGLLETAVPVKVVGCSGAAAQAVRWLRERGRECDLGIVDIFLQQGSGLDVLAAVRDSGQDIKLVVLTNFATEAMREQCRRLGADQVFDKSNELDTLIGYCERLAAAQGEMATSPPLSPSP